MCWQSIKFQNKCSYFVKYNKHLKHCHFVCLKYEIYSSSWESHGKNTRGEFRDKYITQLCTFALCYFYHLTLTWSCHINQWQCFNNTCTYMHTQTYIIMCTGIMYLFVHYLLLVLVVQDHLVVHTYSYQILH